MIGGSSVEHRPPERDPAAGRPRRGLRAGRDRRTANRPFNLIDGHDVVEGNAEDDIVTGDNAFVDRYTRRRRRLADDRRARAAARIAATDRPNSEPARGAWTATDMVRRDVTTRTVQGERRRVRQRLRPRRRRQGRRLRPARQRLARGQRGRGRDRRRHGQDRRQPARRPDAGHDRRSAAQPVHRAARSRSSARRSTTPARSSAR